MSRPPGLRLLALLALLLGDHALGRVQALNSRGGRLGRPQSVANNLARLKAFSACSASPACGDMCQAGACAGRDTAVRPLGTPLPRLPPAACRRRLARVPRPVPTSLPHASCFPAGTAAVHAANVPSNATAAAVGSAAGVASTAAPAHSSRRWNAWSWSKYGWWKPSNHYNSWKPRPVKQSGLYTIRLVRGRANCLPARNGEPLHGHL